MKLTALTTLDLPAAITLKLYFDFFFEILFMVGMKRIGSAKVLVLQLCGK